MRLIIDRFEDNFAVCEDENKKMINLEKSKLPSSVKEGDALDIEGNDINVNAKETRLREKKMKEMMDKLWK